MIYLLFLLGIFCVLFTLGLIVWGLFFRHDGEPLAFAGGFAIILMIIIAAVGFVWLLSNLGRFS